MNFLKFSKKNKAEECKKAQVFLTHLMKHTVEHSQSIHYVQQTLQVASLLKPPDFPSNYIYHAIKAEASRLLQELLIMNSTWYYSSVIRHW